MKKRLLPVLFGVSLLLPWLVFQPGWAASSRILIRAVKTDGANTSSQPDAEYAEIVNVSGSDIADLTSWTIEYVKSASAGTDCQTADWSTVVSTTLNLSGSIPADGSVRVPIKMLDDKGGALRLSHIEAGTPIVDDVVGWESEASPSYCFETAAANIPGDNELLQRCVVDDQSSDSDNNAADFSVIGEDDSTPRCADDEPTPPDSEDPTYYPVYITELLPDPVSPKIDAEDEFIELHNPHAFAVNLAGYQLFTGSSSSSYSYVLPDVELRPGAYKAFYSRETNLTLVNSTGRAWLLDPAETILDETESYADVGADESWALINGSWQITNNVTPSLANLAASTETEGVDGGSASSACPAGKFRNPETNRCKTIEEVLTSLVPCKPGQTRNPETNRCRASVVAGNVLSACKSDQERNPATNRCRKVAGASVLASCQTGQERNPETNRCRKASSPLGNPASTAGSASDTAAKLNVAVLGLVSAAAIGYGGYEYRHDIANAFHRLRSRFAKVRALK